MKCMYRFQPDDRKKHKISHIPRVNSDIFIICVDLLSTTIVIFFSSFFRDPNTRFLQKVPNQELKRKMCPARNG